MHNWENELPLTKYKKKQKILNFAFLLFIHSQSHSNQILQNINFQSHIYMNNIMRHTLTPTPTPTHITLFSILCPTLLCHHLYSIYLYYIKSNIHITHIHHNFSKFTQSVFNKKNRDYSSVFAHKCLVLQFIS